CWQQAAARQFRHFLFVFGNLLLTAARNSARRPRLIGKDIADLRARRRRERDAGGGDKGRKSGQDGGSQHLAAITSESGERHGKNDCRARPPVNTPNTAGKGRL